MLKHNISGLGLLILLGCLLNPVSAMENQLADHPSPYLAMHGADPVQWQDWNENILEQAKKEGKLLFISSGYFSCHWCHVMRRESYNNTDIAALLNKHFIPVKLDRELEPALDQYLIDFVQRTQGRAGWPLNVFLTPEGYPLIGMTYLPPDNFKQMLTRLQQTWSEEEEKLRDMARRALLALLSERAQEPATKLLSKPELMGAFERTAMQYADKMQGGFGQQNRFPMAPQLSLLLQLYKDKPSQEIREYLKLTLDQMANNGMRDQLGGGFYRYTVDPGWLTPHYEKMLYTQALLARLYLDAAVILEQPDYLDVAADTLDFVIRTMAGAQGGYIASFSAVDNKDVEGGYYLWTPEEVKNILDKDGLLLADQYWGLQLGTNVEEGRLPMGGVSVKKLAKGIGKPEKAVRKLLDKARASMMAARNKRVLPVDNKELAGWNGLLLGAFAQAAKQLDRKDYSVAAKGLRDFLVNKLWQNDMLYRARQGDKPLGAAALEDYAYVADGLALWADVSGNKEDRRLSNKLLTLAWQRFHNEEGWQSAAQTILPGMPRDKAQEDGALPSPTAVILRLSLKSGDSKLVAKASNLAGSTMAAIQDNPFWYAGHVAGLLRHSPSM